MKVILVKPDERATVAEIGNDLESMQQAVGGYIEALYCFDDVAIVCNEEGKINGLSLNRALYDDNGTIVDIIAGTFFVCGLTEEDFGDLTNEQANKYLARFLFPEMFFRINGEIKAVKVADLNEHT